MLLHTREDILNSTVFELLKDCWLLCKNFKENENAKYYFWLPNYKRLESLERKWLPCLPELKFCTEKIEKLC